MNPVLVTVVKLEPGRLEAVGGGEQGPPRRAPPPIPREGGRGAASRRTAPASGRDREPHREEREQRIDGDRLLHGTNV